MIYEYEVATAINNSDFVNEFEKRLCWIKEKGYTFYIDIEAKEKYDLISFYLQGINSDSVFRDEDVIYIFKHQMAEVLAEHIVNEWETRLLWKEIFKSCKRNSPDERQIIFNKSSDFLRRCNENESLNLLINFSRKNRISHRLLNHINTSDRLVVEGFLNFCMQDYLTEIRFAVDLAIEELRNEKEYNEFVRLLRYFVDSQVPKTYEVNLMMDGKGVFYLWDSEGTKIEENYISYYLDDMLLDEINLDDVLISILITIAPRKIVLHNAKDNIAANEAVAIIKSVFHEKIHICDGCERCYSYLKEKDSHRHT